MEDGTSWTGNLHVMVKTLDDSNTPDCSDEGNAMMLPGVTAPADALTEPIDRASLMKDFASLLADKTKDLSAANEELRDIVRQKDKRIAELEQLNAQLQNTITSSFNTLISRLGKGEA
jgi:hypothetical protein